MKYFQINIMIFIPDLTKQPIPPVTKNKMKYAIFPWIDKLFILQDINY